MSPRLKVIIAVIIGAVAVASQLALDQRPIEYRDTSLAFIRLGIVFVVPFVVAVVAGLTAKGPNVASAWANAFVVVTTLVAACLVVADIIGAAA